MIRTLLAAAAFAVATGAQAAPLPCQPQSLLDPTTIREWVILIGEQRGTNEIPAFASGLACSLLQQGREVVLTLALRNELQPELDRYLASDGSEAARKLLYKSEFGWDEDGLGSAAYLDMIEQVRVLRAQGAPISLAVIRASHAQAWPKPGEKWSLSRGDRIVAGNIAALVDKHPAATVINMDRARHATKRKGDILDKDYEPVGYVLSQQMPVLSIAFAHTGGSAWTCMSEGTRKTHCGRHTLRALDPSAANAGLEGFDRVLKLGRLTASPPAREDAAQHCEPQSQFNAAAIRERVILVGELHGTEEMPAFVSGLACSLLQAGRQVVLSLELPGDVQAEIERYLASEGSEPARQPLYGSRFGKLLDGRGSIAYMEVIERVRVLRKKGVPISVAATDVSQGPGERKPGSRDSVMADNIAALARSNPAATVISLSGNSHARKKKGGHTGANFEPMGYLLTKQMPTHAISFAHRGGTAWVCMPDCGVQDIESLGNGSSTKASGYDRVVQLGAITASPPIEQSKAQ